MKVKFNIDSRFKEPEIHICCDVLSSKANELKDLLEDILLEKITVYKNFETKAVALHEVVRIYSNNKKVYLRTADEIYEVKERLYVLEERLNDKNFVRISNTEIVNISKIEKLDMTYVGTIKMIMKNSDITFVSRRNVSRLKAKLKEKKI